MLGQDEHETDTKNRTSTNSASELTNPLEMVKYQFRLLNRSILRSELGVRPKYGFGHRSEINRHKKSECKEFSFWANEPLRNGKKNMSGFGIAPFWCSRSVLGRKDDGGPRWAWNRYEKKEFQRIQLLSSRPLRNGKKPIQAFESLNSEVRARS